MRISCTWVQCTTFVDRLDRATIVVFRLHQKHKKVVEDVEIWHLVKFRWILLSCFRGEVENVSANQRPSAHLVFPTHQMNTHLVEDIEILLPVKFSYISLSGIWEEVEKRPSQSEAWWPSYLDIKILLPVKFSWIILFFRSDWKIQT